MADISQKVNDQVERIEEQTINHQSKVAEAQNHIDVLEKKIEEKEAKIGTIREQIAENKPKKQASIEQILNAKKRVTPHTIKTVNNFLNKHSTPVVCAMIEKLVGMLSGKGGQNADRISVALYFKTLEGLLRSIDEFNFKEVRKDMAEEHASFGKIINTDGDDLNMRRELHTIFSEKQADQTTHFYTLHALMQAHANLVIISHEDADCNRYIEKFESQIDSDRKEIELKQAVIGSMKTKDELEAEKAQLLESQEAFARQNQRITDELRELKRKIDNFEEEYFAALN